MHAHALIHTHVYMHARTHVHTRTLHVHTHTHTTYVKKKNESTYTRIHAKRETERGGREIFDIKCPVTCKGYIRAEKKSSNYKQESNSVFMSNIIPCLKKIMGEKEVR